MKLFILILSFYSFDVLSCSYNRPVIIAHRGASGYLPEHTLEAKVASFFMQADYLEQDVVLTRDNVPIVLHDVYLDTVTDVAKKYPDRSRQNGRYYAIDFDFAEIKNLSATERFDISTGKPVYQNRFPLDYASFQLNSLEEEIQLVQGLMKSLNSIYKLDKTNFLSKNREFNTGIYVEIKEPEFHKENNKPDFSEIVINLLKKYNYTTKNDNVIIQCFDINELKRIREDLKSDLVLVALLYPDKEHEYWNTKAGLTEIKKFADGIGPELGQLITWDNKDKNTIRPSEMHIVAKQLGLFMHPFTFRIDSLPAYADSYVELLDLFIDTLQVDGLFTDFSDLTIQYLRNTQTNSSSSNFFQITFFLYLLINTIIILSLINYLKF